MTVREYDISNLNCADCGSKIEARIKTLPGVNSANLDFINKKLRVEYHSKVDNPLERLNLVAGSIEPGVVISHPGEGSEARPGLRFWSPLAVGTLLMAVAALFPTPFSPWVSLAAYLLVGHRVLIAAVKSIGAGQLFSEKLLMSIATVGALFLGEYVEAGAVMLLYEIGQWLEDRAVEKSRGAVKAMLALKPDEAHLKTEQGTQDRRLSDIAAGDTILVYPGERIPLDGTVRKGQSSLDTSSLTGEAEPLFVSENTEVFAGFLNNSGLLEIEVTGTEAESTITRVMNMIEHASARKSRQEKFITQFSRYYTPTVVGLAALVFLVPTLLGWGADIWLKRALVFLIVSCPCALVISIPLTYYIGIGGAAKRGIILKGSSYLDVLRKVDTVVFDKTGTLTTGELRLEKILVKGEHSPDELLEALYRCEFTSSHPFAAAIKTAYTGLYEAKEVAAYSEYSGQGVLLQYGSDRLIAGSAAFLGSYGFLDLIAAEGSSAVHAAKNDLYLGCVTFSDELKPGIAEALAALKEQGVKRNIMLSGDKLQKAESVSRELGLDGFFAELLPGQKLAKLEEIMRGGQGRTAFVGDGMNDAPALARADVGIAMGKIGNQVSVESADVVLLNDHPKQLAELFQISRATGRTVVQNVALALGVKVLVMALGLGGISGLWEAIIADVGVTLLVIFNSLRLTRQKAELDKNRQFSFQELQTD